MKFEILENNGLELIGIVKKIEMKKGPEECPAFWKEFSDKYWIPMMQAGKPLNEGQQARSTTSSADATRVATYPRGWKCAK